MKKPRVLLLSAGEGKRFYPFVTHKSLFTFLGKPLIQYTLEMLERLGFKDIIAVTNEETDSFLTQYSTALRIQTIRQPKARGMADAMIQAKDLIGNDPIIVMNDGDMVNDSLFQNLLSSIENTPYAVLTGRKVKGNLPLGYFKTDGKRIIEIVEKPEPGKEPSDITNLVFHYFSQPGKFVAEIESLSDKNEDDLYEQALSQLMTKQTIEYIEYEDYWQKLKYPFHVLDMMELFTKEYLTSYISPSAKISDKATIEGLVYIDDEVVIETGAVVKGPAYIGKKSIIGNNTLVRQSILESGVVAGFTSEIARSYIGPRCMLHHNFIGDSVLEADVNPSWGSVTGNFLLKKYDVFVKSTHGNIPSGRKKLGAMIAKGVFSGVNCTFMPGVCIEAGSLIKPASVIS